MKFKATETQSFNINVSGGNLNINQEDVDGVTTTSTTIMTLDKNKLYVNGTIGMTENIVHGDNTDTYFGFPATDTFAVTTLGVERMRIDEWGNVGIGRLLQPSDTYKLYVNGTIGMTENIVHGDNTDTYFGFPATDTFAVTTLGVERMRIDEWGNVGIGRLLQPSDTYKLYVNGTIGMTGYIVHGYGDTNTFFGFPDWDTFAVTTLGIERMRIDSDGVVAIGGSGGIPSYELSTYKLYVNGTMHVTGTITGNISGNASTANTLVGGPTLSYTSPLSGDDSSGLGSGSYWNHGGQYQLKLASTNNCMVFRVSRTDNARQALIQVGHKDGGYDQHKGSLFLNRWGGSVYVGNSVGVTSDDRVKHNEKPIKNALSIIKQLKPLNYIKTFKMYDRNHHFDLDASGVPINEENRKLIFESEYIYETGLIAQKVREIPELEFCVRGVESEISKETIFKKDSSGNDILDEDGKKIIEKEIERVEERKLHMDYNSIFTMHIAATQEIDKIQQAEKTKLAAAEAEIVTLKNKATSLETTVADLISRITALENP